MKCSLSRWTPSSTRSLTLALVLGFAATAVSVGAAHAETKKARAGDVAQSYELDSSGRFYRIVDGKKCQITTKVAEFKVSSHKSDVAVAYYIRRDKDGNNLYGLYNADDSSYRNCPKARREKLMERVAKKGKRFRYNIVATSKTTLVAMALNRDGAFVAWSNEAVALSVDGVADYRMHQRFGVKGASFRRYAAFAITDDGYVLKLNGKKPSASKAVRDRRYKNLSQFARANEIR